MATMATSVEMGAKAAETLMKTPEFEPPQASVARIIKAALPSDVQLSKDAKDMADIIADWQRTGDDKEFAMKTRFFPSGVKIPGVKWT